MKLGARTVSNINAEMKEVGLVELEDSIVLSINEEIQNRFTQVTEIFTDLIRFLSKKSNSNNISYIEVFDKYREADEKIGEIYSNDILQEILESHKEKMLYLNDAKAQIIAKHLALGCGANVREINSYINLQTQQQIKKFTSIIIEDLEKNDKYLQNLNEVTYELITNILEKFNEEENEIENEVITTKDITRFEYIPNYKDLERIAKEKGFEYKSCKGSHHKWENNKGKVVIIPAHSQMGLGLSLIIQKRLAS